MPCAGSQLCTVPLHFLEMLQKSSKVQQRDFMFRRCSTTIAALSLAQASFVGKQSVLLASHEESRGSCGD